MRKCVQTFDWYCIYISRYGTHNVKQVGGPVGRTPLRDEPSERHAVQDLHQEVVLRQRPLAQEGRLETQRRSEPKPPQPEAMQRQRSRAAAPRRGRRHGYLVEADHGLRVDADDV